MEGKIPNLIKDIYKNVTANTILNGEKIKAFLLRLEQGKNILMLLFRITLGVVSIDDEGDDDDDDDEEEEEEEEELKATRLEKKVIKVLDS